MTKRVFDIVLSIAAIAVFCIPALCIVFIIKIFYRHPVLFLQERIGKNKKVFIIYKFQTMINEKPTKFGSLLRKTGLDEIAQFINVFKGDMSIVGPRALMNKDIVRLNWDSDYYNVRWSIKPGITGFAQVYGGQHKKTSWFWDKKYILTSNVLKDFILIVVSFSMNIAGKKRIRQLIWPNKTMN